MNVLRRGIAKYPVKVEIIVPTVDIKSASKLECQKMVKLILVPILLLSRHPEFATEALLSRVVLMLSYCISITLKDHFSFYW